MEAACRNNKTYLKEYYCTAPLKLANVTEQKAADFLQLMITSSSPGILDNDNYLVEVCIGENAKLHLGTQGYQRLFAMANRATQGMNFRLQNNSSVCYLPHPVVPHKSSNFSSVNKIYLKKNHHLIWGEVVTCGRKLSDEVFEFTCYHSTTNIYIGDKLVVRENVFLEPFKKKIGSIGLLEGYTHQASLLFMTHNEDFARMRSACCEILLGFENILFGISTLPVHGFVVRILGNKAEKLFNINKALASALQPIDTLHYQH